MIIVTDITILFSDLISLIVPLQTWNVKYYKYAISEITSDMSALQYKWWNGEVLGRPLLIGKASR